MNSTALLALALIMGLVAALGAMHPMATTTTVANTTTTTSTTVTTSPVNVTTTTAPANESMAQNATCVAARVHIELSLFFYQKVTYLANLTGQLKLVNSTLSKAYNLTISANETLGKGLCFTALKEAIEAIHLEQDAWHTIISGYAKEKHLNLTEAIKAEAKLRILNRTLTVAYRIANETGNETLINELRNLINQTKLAAGLIKAGNYTGALKVLNSVEESIKSLAKQVHQEAKKWADEYRVLHGRGKGQGKGNHGHSTGSSGSGEGKGKHKGGH